MKLVRLSPASFIHFGTTKELLNLMTVEIGKYSFLDWKNTVETNISSDEYAASNSYISRGASVGKGSYIEDCRIHTGSSIGENCVISGITLFGQRVPDDTVLHGLKLKNGKFVVRMYGVCDNPKEKKYFGNDISVPLWDAKLFPVCDTIEEAVTATLSGKKDGELLSLNESFNMADVTAIIPWQENLSEQVKAETILEMIDCKVPVSDVKDLITEPNSHTIKYLIDRANELNIEVLSQFSTKIRIYAYLSKLVSDQKLQDEMASACLSVVCEATLKSIGDGIKFYKDKKFVKDETVVNLPVRVNWGGGWSDTPPYCMENGGTVLNASISLNGQLPIEVTIKKIKENKLILASTDIGSYKEFDDVSSSIQELQNCKNPSDPFALHKAALVACGVIPRQENISITDIANSLGGGLYMNTRVINIPKGSGLGTSSILAGACVKAINEAFDHKWCDEELYERVLCMEQLMSTGGGWQDQVGGISRGIKMAISKPGISQEIKCTPLMIDKDVYEELNSRFFVIYTGQRRLARNLLREVITKYICNDKVSLEAHYAIQRLAVLMRFELEKGNIDGFAKLLNEHWLVSQKIDKGSTNTCIDQIFMSIDDLICGKMICGAGGGGFLQVVLKKGVTKEQLDARIKDVFQDSGVEVWDCDFV
jgi:fucokinase